MKTIADRILGQKVTEDELSVTWLGQAGFTLKLYGALVMVDPYLSDSVERLCGFKRLMMSVLDPAEIVPDIFLCTHHHEDHFDVDSVPIIMSHEEATVIGSKTSCSMLEDMRIARGRIHPLSAGEKIEIKGISIHAVFADHGELAKDAVGFFLRCPACSLYIAGDTGYVPDKIIASLPEKPDIAILPINGAYGNLNGEQAARLAHGVGARVVIPCHFWTFAEHGGDPQGFKESLRVYAGEVSPRFLSQGESFLYRRGM